MSSETRGLALGCHLSTAKGFEAMGRTALEIGATTFAFFTRNPRGGNAKPIDADDAAALRALTLEHGFGTLVAHSPYTMNLCSAKPETVDHPGSHVGQGADAGIDLIVEGLNQVLQPGQSTTVLLETMAGKGTEVGRSFEELARIIDGVEHDELLGVCLDTCHVSDAGYDVAADLDGVLAEFDRAIGLDRLRALHLNDSKNPVGAHKDRHERIGEGTLGVDAFARIVRHPLLSTLPMVLETPNELDGYAREIALLRELAEGEAR